MSSLGQNEQDYYQQCVALSRKGDIASLKQLMSMYLVAGDNQKKKDARKALKKAYDRQSVLTVIRSALDSVSSSDQKLDILWLAISIDRSKFLFEYLSAYCLVKGKIKRSALEDIKVYGLFTQEELGEIARYIVVTEDYSPILFRELDETSKRIVKDSVIDRLYAGITNRRMLALLEEDEEYIQKAQGPLTHLLKEKPELAPNLYRFLHDAYAASEDVLEPMTDLFSIYKSIHNANVSDAPSDTKNEKLKIAFRVKKREKLTLHEWEVIKNEVDRTIESADNINGIDTSFFLFLRALARIDITYAERLYQRIYDMTGFYSGRVMNEMVETHTSIAYRILFQRLIGAKDDVAKAKTLQKLIKFYPDKANSILSFIKSQNEKWLAAKFDELVKKYEVDLSDDSVSDYSYLFSGQFHTLIDRSIVVSDLLCQIASTIHANAFCVAVGFGYTSGFKMLSPVINEVAANAGVTEIILGSLQGYGTEENNTRIDRASARFLNSLLDDNMIRLFRYPSTFYHGKFYYLSNGVKSYVIIGSSNISKTAYLSNYELDSLFQIEAGSADDERFLGWYNGFKFDCDLLQQLDITQFEDFDWQAERIGFGGSRLKALTRNDINRRINELTDAETKARLEMWLSHQPAEIYSNLNIPALTDYIVFLFESNGLAVFESFTPGNAYYTFHYDDLDKLLEQLTKLSKTKMLLASEFLMRGYHIQDYERLESKISKLFYSAGMDIASGAK